MQQSISYPTREPPTPTGPNATVSRLRTVTGNRYPRKCACGCGLGIPRDPEIRYVVDFGSSRPYPAYLREHSPDYGTYRAGRDRKPEEDAEAVPGFRPASELLHETPGNGNHEVAHSDADASPTPEAGRAWASGQLVFNAGHLCIFRLENEPSNRAMPGDQPTDSATAVVPHYRYMIFIG